MLRKILATRSVVALAAAMLVAPACAQYGMGLDDILLNPGRSSSVTGEVRRVDSRGIQLRAHRGGSQWLRVDRRTRVVYGQRSYPVSALERGDLVTARVEYDRRGEAWADRIDVRQSVRDVRRDERRDRGRRADRGRSRGGVLGGVRQVDGSVGWVDARRGAFQVSQRSGGAVLVHLPRDAARSTRQRFERLRRGDRVRAEVRPLRGNGYELVRFR